MLTGLVLLLGSIGIAAIFAVVGGLIGVGLFFSAAVELRNSLRRHRDAAHDRQQRNRDAAQVILDHDPDKDPDA